MKDKVTNMCGNQLLQKDFINSLYEIKMEHQAIIMSAMARHGRFAFPSALNASCTEKQVVGWIVGA